MKIDKTIVNLFRSRPKTFKGTQFEWAQLVRGMCEPPDKEYSYSKVEKKNKKTGEVRYEWIRYRN
jgi:hypothetical protein